MRTLKLTLGYDGTDFYGWQIQPDRRTVQGEVEKALAVILEGPVRIVGAGRTDRGVHALGQVASLVTDRTLEPEALQRGLNSLLPADVLVRRVEEVPEGFHARYSATDRAYRYHVARRPGPIRRRYAWILAEAPSAASLDAAAAPLLGSHPFDAFTAGEGLEGDTTCHVREVAWREEGHRLWFSIRADRFIYRMVRFIVGTLIGLGLEGRLHAEAVADLLAEAGRGAPYPAAPPNGLFFLGVTYPATAQMPS